MWVQVPLQSLKLHISRLFLATIECDLLCVRDMIRTFSQMHRTNKYSQHNSIIWAVWLNLRIKLSWVRVPLHSLKAPVSSKKFLDIQATIESGFNLKRVRDMVKAYSQMHRTDMYSQHSSIIWPVWLNGWVFFYELWLWVWVPLQLLYYHLFKVSRVSFNFLILFKVYAHNYILLFCSK